MPAEVVLQQDCSSAPSAVKSLTRAIAEQRQKAYEADQMRRERAAAARRAAAAQQARAAEYQRIQREKASAANMAAAKADGGSPVKAQDTATGLAPKEDLSST